MLSKINPTRTAAWKKLKAHKAEIQKTDLKTLFKNDLNRFDKYSQIFEGSLFDYSKNIATQETFNLLFELAKETQLESAIQKMFTYCFEKPIEPTYPTVGKRCDAKCESGFGSNGGFL